MRIRLLLLAAGVAAVAVSFPCLHHRLAHLWSDGPPLAVVEPLQHLGPQEVETKPELLCFNAPRCLRSITYGHLFICACVAIGIHLLPPMLEGLLYLPSPALEEAPSIDEKVADLIHVAWCEVSRGCLSGGLEGQAVRRRV